MAESDSRLTLLRELSRSGIATVWEAYDRNLDRKVLLKSINPQYARESDLRVRFEREARAIARLSHPNVVQIFDLRVSGDDLALILEFIEGASLGKLLKERGALPAEVAVTIAADILSGLEHAHASGIIHRDLKPDNVLVSSKGEVKITDFGLATLRDQPTVTQEGMVIGTPAYMAPEQAEGSEITGATDVFALGLILFEMLTARRLMEGGSLAETFQNVLRYQPPRFEAFRQQIPETLEPVLRRMLERSPARRYSTAAEASQALLAAAADGVLPKALIADFLSGEPVRRPASRPAARTRTWKHPVRNIVLSLLALTGAALVFLFATLTNETPVVTRPTPDSTASEPGGTAVEPSRPAHSLDTTAARSDTLIAGETEREEPSVHRPLPRDTAELASLEQPRPDTLPSLPVLEPGLLTISSRPWASVYLGDSLVGTTPLPGPLRLPGGTHTVVLMNPEIGHPISRSVTVGGGQTTDLRVNLYDFVSRIRIASVKPWADVYINGVFELRTPSSKLIFRPLGTYTVTLKNPDFPDYSETLVFREADPIREIRVDLSQR